MTEHASRMNVSNCQGHRRILFVGALLAVGVPANVSAQMGQDAASAAEAGPIVRVMKVSAAAQPWDTRSNRGLDFGMHNGKPPVVLVDANLSAGSNIQIVASGTTTTVVNGAAIDAVGQPDFPTNSQPEFGTPRFPSRYLAKDGPVPLLNGVIAAFVDADGRVIGKPFAVGRGVTVRVPDRTSALSLGINDDNFSDNTGALTVTVTLPRATVTVE